MSEFILWANSSNSPFAIISMAFITGGACAGLMLLFGLVFVAGALGALVVLAPIIWLIEKIGGK